MTQDEHKTTNIITTTRDIFSPKFILNTYYNYCSSSRGHTDHKDQESLEVCPLVCYTQRAKVKAQTPLAQGGVFVYIVKNFSTLISFFPQPRGKRQIHIKRHTRNQESEVDPNFQFSNLLAHLQHVVSPLFFI